MKYFISLLSLLFLVSACNKEKKQAKKEEDSIKKYISDHNLSATATGSGLYYVVDQEGTGSQPNSSSQVKVEYKGYFTDGSEFDKSDTAGVTFGLSNVISGWTEGIPYFKEGGRGKLLIPSKLGYGPEGRSGIPGNSILIFDIRLIDVL